MATNSYLKSLKPYFKEDTGLESEKYPAEFIQYMQAKNLESIVVALVQIKDQIEKIEKKLK